MEQKITPVIFNLEQATSLNKAAKTSGKVVAVHVKVDTGMGRLGVRWHDLDKFLQGLSHCKNLKIQGAMSHLASANDPKENDFTDLQIDRFLDAVAKFEAAGFSLELTDIANSPGSVGHPRSRSQMVRLGGILYGLGKDVLDQRAPKPELRPVLALYSAIADIKNISAGETLGYGRTFTTLRESKLALVPIGYNDGCDRKLSNKASVLIRGSVAPVVGRVSMDWTIVDVTDIDGVGVGDRVTLIGRDGDRSVSSEDLALQVDTISYEITCGISSRVPRKFVE